MKTKVIESAASPNDLEVDVQTVMARVRQSMVEHALDDHVEFPTYAAARAKSDGGPARFPEEMYYQLEQANLNYDKVLSELAQIESQLPLVGAFVNRFKGELHRLVIFYVNMMAERQVTVNEAVVNTLNHLVDRLETGVAPTTQDPEIKALLRQIAELQGRLERLEARMADSESNA